MTNAEVSASIMELLTNKREQIRNQISEKFKKLMESIESKRKEVVKNIDSTAMKAETKLKNLMKIDAKILGKYSDW
jgi:uncharacterized protein YllA (UPF0747 family)